MLPPFARLPALVAALVGAGALLWSWPSDSQWQVLPRLSVAFAAVQVLPGWLLLRRTGALPSLRGWVEKAVVSYAVSYIISTAIDVAVTVLQLNVTIGLGVLLVVVLALLPGQPALPSIRIPRRTEMPPTILPAGLALAAVAYLGYCAWVLEPRIGGEEIFEVTVLRKLVESQTITLTNLLHRPDASFPYLFTPFYFATALIAKLSGLPLLTVYMKLRTFYVLASLGSFLVIARRFSASHSFAVMALLGVCGLIVVDPDPWMWPASLFPQVRRGAFTAGVLVPWLILTFHYCVFDARSKWAVALPALLVFATLSTQSMGVVFFLFWMAGFSAVGLVSPEWRQYRQHWVALWLAIGLALVTFVFLHRIFVGHVDDYLQAGRLVLSGQISAWANAPLDGLFSGVSSDGRYLIVTTGSVIVYSMIAITLMPLLLFAAPVFARALWLPLAAAIALYSTPLTLAVLQFLTIPEAVFAGGYFSLLGLLGYLAVVYLWLVVVDRWWAAVRPAGFAARLAALLAVCLSASLFGYYAVATASWWVMEEIIRRPVVPAVVGLGVGGLVWLAGRRWPRPELPGLPELTRPAPLAVVFVCLTMPVFIALKNFPGQVDNSTRQSTWRELQSRRVPSVTDWPAYYRTLQSNWSFDVPLEVIADLTRLLPPHRIVLFDPSQSIMIPFLLNQYIVNPGILFSTDIEYYTNFVTTDATGEQTHPIFNQSKVMTGREREFIEAYQVDYILVNPRYAAVVQPKISGLAGFELKYEKAGFLLYGRSLPMAGGAALSR